MSVYLSACNTDTMERGGVAVIQAHGFRRWRALVAVGLLVVLLVGTISGCSPQQAASKPSGKQDVVEEAVTVRDSAGRQVEVKRTPSRVISLAPSNTEMVFALGAGTLLVGVDEYSDYPEEAKAIAKVGGFSNPNPELIASLKPDLLLVDDIHRSILDQLVKIGCPVVLLAASTVEEVENNIRVVGQVLRRSAQAEQLVRDMESRLSKVREKVKAIPSEKRVKVFYEVYSDPIMTVGPRTLIHHVIVAAGGRNVAEDAATDYPQYSPEAVVQKNPDVIVFPAFHGSESLTVEKLRARPGWSSIKAVSQDRVYPIDANVISRPGPRIVDAVESMARLLYPELFK
ncbi:MAG: ABC transporter substrate-binding protein [Bacillota bacterium]